MTARLLAEAGDVLRCFRSAVIGGKDDQRPVQTDRVIHVAKELAEESIDAQNGVFVLEARGPEEVSGGVRGRQADGEVIGGDSLPDLFAVDEGLGEIERKLVSHRRDVKNRVEELGATVTQWVRKGPSKRIEVGLVGSVVEVTGYVAGSLLEELPGLSLVAVGRLPGVPILHPPRILLVVVSAGDELPTAVRVPEGLAAVSARQDGAPVLRGDAEDARTTGCVDHQLVANRRRAQVAGRDPLVRSRLTAEDVVAVIFCVVDELAGMQVNPVVGHDAVARRVGAGDDRCMTGSGLGVGVVVVGVLIPGAAVEEVAEPVRPEAVAKPGQGITSQLVDRDL